MDVTRLARGVIADPDPSRDLDLPRGRTGNPVADPDEDDAWDESLGEA